MQPEISLVVCREAVNALFCSFVACHVLCAEGQCLRSDRECKERLYVFFIVEVSSDNELYELMTMIMKLNLQNCEKLS